MVKTISRYGILFLAATLLAAAQTAPPADSNPPSAPPQQTQMPAAEAPPAQTPPAPPPYQPKFRGDPAHSDAEAAALGYMRTLINAERLYKKKNDRYATSLAELAGHGSFTKRMVKTDRGDYTVKFHAKQDEYTLEMIPKQYDAAHRAFFVNDSGVIRGEDGKPASLASAPLKAD